VIRTSEQAFIAHQRPMFPAIAWLDVTLPDDSKTLVLGVHESYWFGKRVRTAGNFDGPRVVAYLGAPSPVALYEKLRADGFTHVALYSNHLVIGSKQQSGRYAESVTSLDPQTADTLRTMLAHHARLLGEGQGVKLLALAATSAAKP